MQIKYIEYAIPCTVVRESTYNKHLMNLLLVFILTVTDVSMHDKGGIDRVLVNSKTIVMQANLKYVTARIYVQFSPRYVYTPSLLPSLSYSK